MRFLLDTAVVLAILNEDRHALPRSIARQLSESDALMVSVASLWELAIKHRLGKLSLEMGLEEIIGQLEAAGLRLLPVTGEHVLAEAVPVPETRDPFDRLLLAVARVEQLLVLTTDRALEGHPSVWPRSK